MFQKILKNKNKKLRWPITRRSTRHNGGQRLEIGVRSPVFSLKCRWPVSMIRLADALAAIVDALTSGGCATDIYSTTPYTSTTLEVVENLQTNYDKNKSDEFQAVVLCCGSKPKSCFTMVAFSCHD